RNGKSQHRDPRLALGCTDGPITEHASGHWFRAPPLTAVSLLAALDFKARAEASCSVTPCGCGPRSEARGRRVDRVSRTANARLAVRLPAGRARLVTGPAWPRLL